jgi:tetratricopeptide (TPR) repeat protein
LRLIVLAFVLALAAPAFAQRQLDEPTRLQKCVERIETDPEGAFEDGSAWVVQTGRPAARHCVALALLALGQEEEAAARLEQLANDKDGGTLEQRALYLTQAGNAWLVAKAPEAAVVTLTNALKLRPQDPDLFIDRARAHITMKKWAEATKDLDAAVRLSPGNAEALGMRAKAKFESGELESAYADVRAALKQKSEDVNVLVLRGQIREAMRAKGMPDPEGL